MINGPVCSERTLFPILDTRDLIPRVVRSEFNEDVIIASVTVRVVDDFVVIAADESNVYRHEAVNLKNTNRREPRIRGQGEFERNSSRKILLTH